MQGEKSPPRRRAGGGFDFIEGLSALSGGGESFPEEASAARNRLVEARFQEGVPESGGVAGQHRLAEFGFERLDALEGAKIRAADEDAVRIGGIHLAGKRHRALGGQERRALGVEPLFSDGLDSFSFEVADKPLVQPPGIGRGDGDAGDAHGAHGLDESGRGRRRGNSGALLDEVGDLLIHARADEAAPRASEAQGVEARVGEQVRQVRDFLDHVEEGLLLVVGVLDAREVDRDALGRQALALVFHHGVPRGYDKAEFFLPVSHLFSSPPGDDSVPAHRMDCPDISRNDR